MKFSASNIISFAKEDGNQTWINTRDLNQVKCSEKKDKMSVSDVRDGGNRRRPLVAELQTDATEQAQGQVH